MRLATATLLLCSACAHALTPAAAGAELERRPGSYLSGKIATAIVQSTPDRRDFTYDLAIDRRSQRAAYTHLAARVYRLSIVEGSPNLLSPTPPAVIANAEVNSNELDVEALAFSPDGQRVVVASHDRSVRLFDLTGHVVAQVATESPLDSVAFAPDGSAVVVGSDDGLLTVLSGTDLAYQSEVRSHTDAVRALAFDDAGVLWSGGFDQRIRSYTLAKEVTPVEEVRMRAHKAGALTAVAGSFQGGAAVLLGFDERAELTTITPEAAQRVGIDVAFLKDHIEQLTPGGKVELPVAKDRTLVFKALSIPDVDVAICGTCVPVGSDGVLGRDFLTAHSVVSDPVSHEVVIHAASGEALPPHDAWTLKPGASWPMPGFVADLTVSRDGSRLGVALDTTRPERNLALYKREKAGDVEPAEPGNVAAIVDAKTGTVLEKHNPHFGFVWTAGISPDGRSLGTGGWDRKVYLYSGGDQPVADFQYGWSVRKVRFSPDGRLLGVAAWTPQNAQGADSDPAAQLIRLDYLDAQLRSP